MKNIDRKGQIVIHQANFNTEPRAVFVGGLNGIGAVCLYILNSGEMIFCDPDKETLLDMDFKALQLLRAEWHVSNAERTMERWLEIISELQDS